MYMKSPSQIYTHAYTYEHRRARFVRERETRERWREAESRKEKARRTNKERKWVCVRAHMRVVCWNMNYEHANIPTYRQTRALSLSLSLSHSLSHTQSLSLSHTHTHTYGLPVSFSHNFSFTHASITHTVWTQRAVCMLWLVYTCALTFFFYSLSLIDVCSGSWSEKGALYLCSMTHCMYHDSLYVPWLIAMYPDWCVCVPACVNEAH